MKASLARQLPYIAATKDAKIVGFASASAFRGFMLGYGHSVEMSIFAQPDHKGQGVGGTLMKAILERLRQTKHLSHEEGHDDDKREFPIKQIMAIMSVDGDGPGSGSQLASFYERWGFRLAGQLRNIGFKNGRWTDTMYYQLEL